MSAFVNSGVKCPAIILARGGSKGIPGKNIMDFAGKPLLAWSILQSLRSGVVDSVYVSSDSAEILEVATRYGAVPVQRPASLSTDTATSEVGILHVLDLIRNERGVDPDRVIFLQATSPLREPADIAGALNEFIKQKADSLFSDAVLDDFCAWTEEDGVLKGKTFDPWNRGRRQDRKPLYLENGSIYVFKPALLRTTGNRLGGKIGRYSMAFWKSYEIDTLENVELCEFYFRKHLLSAWGAGENPGRAERVQQLIGESIEVKSGFLADSRQTGLILEISGNIIEALKRGNKVIFCGNGGSFADSIHLAAEFVSRFQKERGPLAGMALGANNSILTAVGNDYAFAEVFAREIAAVGRAGDVFIAISTSGNSENVLRAVHVAKEMGLTTYGMTGNGGGKLAGAAESLKVPSSKTARIQEFHILAGHIICELVENAVTGVPQ